MPRVEWSPRWSYQSTQPAVASSTSARVFQGPSWKTVVRMLGHSQIALTMNTYAHVLPELEREAVDDVAQRLFE
jgi:integrase